MARPVKMITASKEARAELQRRAKAPTSVHRDRFRANIILLRLEGLKIESVAKRLKTSMAHSVDMVCALRDRWPRRSQ
jgi:hypothetical protein